VLDHFVTSLDASGRILRQIPLLELFRERVPAERFARMSEVLREAGAESPEYERESNVLHPNTIEILPRDLSVAPAGTALLCLRELDLVAIVDLEAGRGELGRRRAGRSPSSLAAGRRPPPRLRQQPATGLVARDRARPGDGADRVGVWGDPRSSFFSDVRSDAQALPNGNVLITESTKGRVFEITRAGEIVWEFWSPTRGKANRRRQFYRMLRLPAERFDAFLGR
jgi:hypothetical protein